MKPITKTFDVPESLSLRSRCASITVRKLGWKRLQRCTDGVYLEAFDRFGERANDLMNGPKSGKSDTERERLEKLAVEKYGAEKVANRKMLAEYSEEQLLRESDLHMDKRTLTENELSELIEDHFDEDDVMWIALRVLDVSGKLPETTEQKKVA